MVDAVILCGGYGTRLSGVVPPDYPKALAVVNGRPFLGILLDHLRAVGFKLVVLCTGVGAALIDEHVVAYCYASWVTTVRDERLGYGTWNAILKASSLVTTDPFFVLNGDTFCALNYEGMLGRHRCSPFQLTRAIDVDGVPVGTFVMNRGLLASRPVPSGSVNLEDVIGADLCPAGLVLDYVTATAWYDIGTPEGLARFREVKKDTAWL